jgi:hypothetical protein
MLRRTKEERKADLQLPPIKATTKKRREGTGMQREDDPFSMLVQDGVHVGIANLDGFKLDG